MAAKPVCSNIKFERILLSTDSSEFSEGAIREAINIAKRCSSKLYVLTVVEFNPEFEAHAPEIMEKADRAARNHLEAVKARAEAEGVACEVIAHQGEETCQYIVQESAIKKADLVITGRRGRRGLKRIMMGSVTERVIGHAPCSVLVVPRSARVEFNNILLATDGSACSDAATKEALHLAGGCGSSLCAMSVAPSERELSEAEANLQKVKELAQREMVEIETVTAAGKPYEAIVETAKKKGSDLIVMGSHGRTGLEKLLVGSVAARVIGLAESAVLVVKD